MDIDPERQRLREHTAREKHWRRWGPYLSERQWGTVREDYSLAGDAWNFVTHDMAPGYAYRWGEDGLAGISDNHQRLCFAVALWNGQDRMLKERLFGLTNPQGNHGEDVKEYYAYLDATPTHSYMRYLYRYPQAAFPYEQLQAENQRRDRTQPEFELIDTGVFDEDRFFDITVEYAKTDPEDILIRITLKNCGPETATLHVLPMLWFRNTWDDEPVPQRPSITTLNPTTVRATHPTLGDRCLSASGKPTWLFTENDTNQSALYGKPNPQPFVKDGFHHHVIHGNRQAVRFDAGSRCGAWYRWEIGPSRKKEIRLRLTPQHIEQPITGPAFKKTFDLRIGEADAFYRDLTPKETSPEHRTLQRRALAGMLWTKQWYHYAVDEWLKPHPHESDEARARAFGRNHEWVHLYNEDVLSMPDKWEYPWYAVWDLAFHTLPLALADPEYAKRQLDILTREWYMHPNGQLPAYEWNFSDVNPPVHAWATWHVYHIERSLWGKADARFLERVFHKLLLNFTWWVNRKDKEGHNIFQGGFLGMDNIGVFDRSRPLPTGGYLEQSDGTSWMAMYSLNLLAIAWELARTNPTYEDIASKFFEHFLYIAHAMGSSRGSGLSLWDEEDGFFYDQIHLPDGSHQPIKIRSMVGLVPLFAVEILDHEQIQRLEGFKRRMEWFLENRPALTENISCIFEPGRSGRCLLSVVKPDQLSRILSTVLDENEFFSDYGVRSLSRFHHEHPYEFQAPGYRESVTYDPGESTRDLFGGNSNWRGPIWFPMNYLLIEALKKYHRFFGDDFTVECPTGSGRRMNLGEVAVEISRRLISMFEEQDGRATVWGDDPRFQQSHWEPLLPFHEYFHGDTGAGLGASHQTGWTGLLANLIMDRTSR